MTLHTLLLVLAAACFVVVIICSVSTTGTVIGMGALGWVGAGALALTRVGDGTRYGYGD